ncbi:MAG: esterase-like activity of phytase family protein [Tagaea sp.]|nr:esterase-like activity of phytase family protein [Tagaea sp.]
MRRRETLALLAGAGVSFFAGPARAAVGWAPLDVRAAPIPLDERDASRKRIDQLVWRGGLQLGADDRRFGGWSDLWVAPDNARAILIGDRGAALDLGLIFDGWLRGVGPSRLGRLIGPDGKALTGRASDAEGLARLPDGGFAVSFEQRHRILIYPPADPPFARPPRAVPAPPGAGEWPANGGMEALARLPDGRFLVLLEESPQAWLGGAGEWAELAYRAADGFKPVSACVAGGTLYVLERAFSWAGLASRIVRLPVAAVREGAALDGEELARLRPPVTLDNYEGIAATKDRAGRDLLWLIADDNFNFLQRTLLACFEVG